MTENHLYKKAYAGGKKASGKYTVIFVLKDKKAYLLKKANPQKEYVNRVGLTVSKKIGGAVQRNRAKRVIRAAFAEIQKTRELKKGNLIVISARESATLAKSTDIFEEMLRQLEKLGMFAGSTRGHTVLPHGSEQDVQSVQMVENSKSSVAGAIEPEEKEL